MEAQNKQLWQIAVTRIEDNILNGNIAEGERAPSKNELSALLGINPITALRAISYLEADGILFTKRGVGAFVAEGARERIYERRRTQEMNALCDALIDAAGALGIEDGELLDILKERQAVKARG